jgi:hypothetical protein
LEQSVKGARAAAQTARERRRAERVHATYGCDDPEVCIAKGLHGDVE